MTRPYDVITFDCYGTLVDWDAGISGAFLQAAAARGVALDRDAVLATYSRHEPAVQAEAFRPYRDVLAEAARRTAAELGLPLAPEDAAFLPESLPHWPVFPDTGPALERLVAAGYRLGVLSNVDPDLFAGTCRHFPMTFDFVVTAVDVRSYKPAHSHFLEGRRRVGGARWLHAAQSHFHDVVPCQALGVDAAWVNRKAEALPPGAAPPRLEVPSLAALVDALARLA